jgi:hypothetical protein
MRLEQPAIEKGYRAEGRSRAAPLLARPVERPEEEWAKEVAVEPPAVEQTTLYLFRQETVTPGEPAFGLDEVQEKHPGELQQGQAMTVVDWDGPGQAGRHPGQGALERLKEASADTFP